MSSLPMQEPHQAVSNSDFRPFNLSDKKQYTHVLTICADNTDAVAALFEELSVEEYEHVNRVNYLGVIYTLKAGTVNMLKR